VNRAYTVVDLHSIDPTTRKRLCRRAVSVRPDAVLGLCSQGLAIAVWPYGGRFSDEGAASTDLQQFEAECFDLGEDAVERSWSVNSPVKVVSSPRRRTCSAWELRRGSSRPGGRVRRSGNAARPVRARAGHVLTEDDAAHLRVVVLAMMGLIATPRVCTDVDLRVGVDGVTGRPPIW